MNSTKKRLIYPAALILSLIVISAFVPVLKSPALFLLKIPLTITRLVGREIGGMIFYHRNMVRQERLQQANELLRSKLYSLNEIYLENRRLKSLLSFKQKASYRVIAARVIGRNPDNWSCALIIDKGRHQGINRGYVVITPLGLAGRVSEADIYTSKVTLINDPNMGVSAVSQRSRQEGLVSGTLGHSLLMRYLPKDADITVGDTVITSGLTELYPKGLLIGRVSAVGEEMSGLSRYALIRPAADLSRIEEVLVIIP